MPMIAAAGILATLFTVIAYALCGPSLGLLLSGVFASGLLVTLLDNQSRSMMHRILLAAAIVDGVALIWLVSVFLSPVTFLQWLQAYVVLLATTASVLSLGLVRNDGRMIAVMWIAWFAAPVLLAQAMLGSIGSAIAESLTRFHPLFALNRVVIDQGAWTSGDIAYRLLTPLGQDVSYALPATVLPCVLGHLGVTAVCLAIRIFRGNPRPASTVPC